MEDNTDMEEYLEEYEMEGMSLDDKMDCHWRMVFKENEVRRYYKKGLLHDKIWDMLMGDKL